MIKLVCIDMDGTLYTKQREILPQTLADIKEAQAKGIQIAIVTGRPINYIMSFQQMLGKDIALAGSNGAYIKVMDKTYTKPITKSALLSIIETIEKYHLHAYVKGLKTIFTNNTFNPFSDYDERTKNLPFEYQMTTEYHSNLYETLLENEDSIYKIIVLGENIDVVTKCRTELHDIAPVSTFSSDAHHFELTSKQADKGTAVKQLADALDIALNEIACIGDSSNDLPMFQICGYRIAMGNAKDEIKAMSDYVSDDHNHNGVGTALLHILTKNG